MLTSFATALRSLYEVRISDSRLRYRRRHRNGLRCIRDVFSVILTESSRLALRSFLLRTYRAVMIAAVGTLSGKSACLTQQSATLRVGYGQKEVFAMSSICWIKKRLFEGTTFGIACLAASLSISSATELHQGLVGYWPLDEGTGASAGDSFGDELDNGTLRNEPSWLTADDAKLGVSALQFDGFEQDVLLPESLDLDIGTPAVSLSAWVNLELLPTELGAGFGGIFDSAQDNYILYLDRGNAELRFKATDADGSAKRPGVPESMLTLDEWHHVMGVYNGEEGIAKIYLNGLLVDSHSNGDLNGQVRAGQLAGIGANPTPDLDNPSTNFFQGAIDDVAVWNRALGRGEAAYLYNAGAGNAVGAANVDIAFLTDEPPVEPVMPTIDPIIHYTFDGHLSNSGTGQATYDGTLLDTAGVNDGILSGGKLDLRENPVSQAVDGDAVSVDIELPESGTIVFNYEVDEYYNFQSLFTNSIEPNDWEMWIYNDGRVRGRVEGDAYVTFDLDTLEGPGEAYEIAFTWEREDDNVAVKLFIDGELRDQDLTGTWVDPGDTLFIGGGDGTNHFANGVFDDFRLYDQALTDGEILYLFEGPAIAGDFDGNGLLDAADLDEMATAMGTATAKYDLDNDGDVDIDDRASWVNNIKGTWFGDANLDGEFNSSDFVAAFTGARYETGASATWAEGDWNGDGLFDTSDFVTAFQAGGYEAGPRVAAINAVPEPSSLGIFAFGILIGIGIRRRRWR